MATLVLLNGPPASGKSTIAARLVERRPLALNLDIDVVRGQLGCWLDDTTAAGVAARTLALAMARVHLDAGFDVVVPQFLARPGLADELASVAAECSARFVSIALIVDRETARSSFAQRSAAPADRTHRDAAEMVDRSSNPDPVGEMFDLFCSYLDTLLGVHRIESVLDDIDGTVLEVEQFLATPPEPDRR